MFPPYVTVTGSGLALWLNMQMLQLTFPDELVVPLQCWAELPEPTVKVTVWPESGVPLLVSVADRVGVFPLVMEVLPV